MNFERNSNFLSYFFSIVGENVRLDYFNNKF